MRYYLKCCSCGEPMHRTHKTCQKCYENYLKGVRYKYCMECTQPFKKLSTYGFCYNCYSKAVNNYVDTD